MARRGTRLILGGTLIGAPIWVGSPAHAATFEVTNLDDSGSGSLRDAITQANAAPGSDVITFQTGLTGTITLSSEIRVGNNAPNPAGGDLTIMGPGADEITISGNDVTRIFSAYDAQQPGGSFVISGLTLANGRANNGGAINALDRSLVLDSVVLTGNTATVDGGALWTDGFLSSVTITDSVLSGNTAARKGGGWYNEDTGGSPSDPGIEVDNTTISGNTAGSHGGGVYFYDPDAPIVISDSTISGNTASTGKGGGIYLYNIDGGADRITIANSTISGNTAAGGGGGAYFYKVTLNVVNSTFAYNTVTGAGANGGGLKTGPAMTAVSISNSTISANTAPTGVAGAGARFTTPATLSHTVIAGNTDSDVSGIVTVGDSLIGNSTGATLTDAGNNRLDVDAQLGPLQDNGGPTATMHPESNSPLLDAGNPAFATPPLTDQRGATRIHNGVIDIGAVEDIGRPDDDTYSTDEEVELDVPAPGVMDNDSDAGTSVTLVTDVDFGSLALADDGGFTYTPDDEYSGSDSFTYRLNGPLGSMGTATVSITVDAVDDPPVAEGDDATAVTGGGPVMIDVLSNDDDVDTSTLAITAVGTPSLGTVEIDSSGSTDMLEYTPGAAIGTDTFSYTISDGTSTSNATVTVDLTDGIRPTVDIVFPASGAVVARNSVVAADFSCADEPGGSGIESCEGTVADGAPLDTSPTGVQEFTVTATDAAGNTTTETRSYRVVKARPDARVLSRSGTLLGDDVYNVTAGQTVTKSVRPGGTASYEVTMQNDARFADSLRIRGGSSTRSFSIRYLGPTGRDITNRVVAGEFVTPVLAPGASYPITVEVTVAETAPPDATISRVVRAFSTTNVRRQDRVVFTTTVR